jgi:hypothetical protein
MQPGESRKTEKKTLQAYMTYFERKWGGQAGKMTNWICQGFCSAVSETTVGRLFQWMNSFQKRS